MKLFDTRKNYPTPEGAGKRGIESQKSQKERGSVCDVSQQMSSMRMRNRLKYADRDL